MWVWRGLEFNQTKSYTLQMRKLSSKDLGSQNTAAGRSTALCYRNAVYSLKASHPHWSILVYAYLPLHMLSSTPRTQSFQHFCMANPHPLFNIKPVNGHEESFRRERTGLDMDWNDSYTNIENHQITHLKWVNLIVCKLYLNLFTCF